MQGKGEVPIIFMNVDIKFNDRYFIKMIFEKKMKHMMKCQANYFAII